MVEHERKVPAQDDGLSVRQPRLTPDERRAALAWAARPPEGVLPPRIGRSAIELALFVRSKPARASEIIFRQNDRELAKAFVAAFK